MAVFIFLRKKSVRTTLRKQKSGQIMQSGRNGTGGRCGSGGRSTEEKLLKIKKEEISTKIAQSISRQGFQPRAFREILLARLQILREYIRKLRIPSKPKLGIDMKEFYEMENLKSKLDQKQE